VTAGLERQRDEFIASLQRQLAQTELQLRQRLSSLAEEAEAERVVLERRLQELARRVDEQDSVPTARR
jgi:hypothetical protein